ncbi:MAG: NAD(P)H-hydrate dehydratase [Gammaproteobacteria bacterium]|nr:NAD(P)H-hydrate dehydratase [Gammaproteobacteria bacterium]MDH3847042.1 NAD(P)H-hydrate dehydratase [Gammaproteobacteria bacterium]MDH3862785.1 NAD(P)H-hydrate dehydratase [Gammaproteobacteria bacterium]MDH3906977.1 NAD(P)H-hydrate dehydratase [Gammaproteobacteria bacterium]MDH4005653.1 NAD(P)H-hydrate dehydratase [Gammaproteobacteria bacterium]
MRTLPNEIYSVATVREIDRSAIEDEGIPGYTLMTRAGAAAVRAAREQFPDETRWQVVCGAGNNAGDGYVVARLAAQDGIVVSALALVDPESLTGDAATAYGDFAAEGGVVMPWEGALDDEAGLIVDALLGSGLERDVTGEFAKAVSAMNAHRARVMALDIPAGVHGDTGEVMGTAVQADLTVTFVGLKAGLFAGEGAELSGVIVFDGLDVPEHCRPHDQAMSRRISSRILRRCLKRRPRSAHKGDFGHVLIIGGGEGMPGAVRLAGEAALRAGAGLVSVAMHPSHATVIVGSRPELMSHGIPDADSLAPLLERATAVAFGPGLGTSDWARQLFAAVSALELPCVWDADALNLLAETPAKSKRRIITPHPGEAGRLLGKTTSAVQGDRRAALNALQEKYGGVVVLKGANTLVTSKKQVPWLCTSGNPGMASPGMGDVLTGVVAALLAQGLGKEASAVVGVEAHARAGDYAARSGERGTIASDLIAELRRVINP